MSSNFRVAIVHDWLNQTGGAENVLEEMVSLFPDADIFTSIYAPDKMPAAYSKWPIHTSFMQALPGIANRHQPYMPIYPFAFKNFNLDAYDVVLSNKSGFCHGVNTAKRQIDNGNKPVTGPIHTGPIHICYCLTPTRFLWSFDQYQKRENIGLAGNLLLRPLLPALRKWDHDVAQDVHFFIAISQEVQRRIKEIYGRESSIIYPPVDTDYFTPPNYSPDGNLSLDAPAQPSDLLASEADGRQRDLDDALSSDHNMELPGDVAPGSYYLIVSRLIPYKRIDLAIDAFRHLPSERLLVVGSGRDGEALEAMATDNVTFLGRLKRSQIRELLRYCKAFIFPGLEDFGIAPVEAMSVGRPVIAFAGGGALDTVVPGLSGELFHEQTPESLLGVLKQFDADNYQPEACRQQAERFSSENFRQALYAYVENVMAAEGNVNTPAAEDA